MPFVIKRGDTAIDLVAYVKDRSGAAVNLSSVSSVAFYMLNKKDSTPKIDGSTATISDAAAGKVTYSFAAADVDEAGQFYAEFLVTRNDGKVYHVPTQNFIEIRINEDLAENEE